MNLQAEHFIVDGERRFLVDYDDVPRIRLGGDVSFHAEHLSFEGEFIGIDYDDDQPQISIDKGLYYGTVGYQYTERAMVYVSYWYLNADFPVLISTSPMVTTRGSMKISGPNLGVSYNLTDRVTLKGQWVHVTLETEAQLTGRQRVVNESNFDILTLAASVFF